MFERFTHEARNVVIGAQHQARQLHHNYIGTEHLLLALLQPDSGKSYAVLSDAGLDAVGVRACVEQWLERSAEHGSALDADDAAALEAIGIDLDAIRAKVEESFGPGALDPPRPHRHRGLFRRKAKPARAGGRAPFTGRAKKVLELSLREAIALSHNHIGSEHILLGLLREGNGLAAQAIRDAGVDLTELRRSTIASLGQAA
jgi:ATP-dependent Clp protease ATP-binding subunit ClpA